MVLMFHNEEFDTFPRKPNTARKNDLVAAKEKRKGDLSRTLFPG
jgi:hypothetical protein